MTSKESMLTAFRPLMDDTKSPFFTPSFSAWLLALGGEATTSCGTARREGRFVRSSFGVRVGVGVGREPTKQTGKCEGAEGETAIVAGGWGEGGLGTVS